METKEQTIQRHKEDVMYCQRQIDRYKKKIANAERDIKMWRIFKMIDELHLWYEINEKYEIWKHQLNKLEKIQSKIN
jgi:hypothetical protein